MMKSTSTNDAARGAGRTRRGSGRRLAAALVCAMLLAGCSGGGEGEGAEGGGSRDLVTTDIGQGYVDGSTTTIVAPPGWEGDAAGTRGGGKDGKKEIGDGGGGPFGFGRKPAGDLSNVTEASVSSVCPASRCTIDGIDIDHPGWGPTRVFTLIGNTGQSMNEAALAAVDSTGEVKWSYTAPMTMAGRWGFAADAPDANEALYVKYNPGRYDGIIALHPTKDGFHSLPDGGGDGDYLGNGTVQIYNAELGELDADGIREIIEIEFDTSGGRSLANAIAYRHFLTWTGEGYEERRPKERMK